jgi:cytochrome c
MKKLFIPLIILFTLLLMSCGGENNKSDSSADDNKEASPSDPKSDKGVGPITSITLDEKIDEAMVKKGQEIYQLKCTACHKPDAKYIGPAPKGILERRSPEFIMNMILAPEKMIAENATVKQMIGENNGAVMANQNLTQAEARAVLEYFRTLK